MSGSPGSRIRSYPPDEGGSDSGVPGLATCSVCRCLATFQCVDCGAYACDPVCYGVHRRDHPKFAKVPPAIRSFTCAACGQLVVRGLNDNRSRYCSYGCRKRRKAA